MQKRVGVIVARFQVAELHQGHRDLIEYAMSKSDTVLIVLGVPGSLPSDRNPLEYAMRAAMVRDAYPGVEVARLSDQLSDEFWSTNLDALLAERYPDSEVTLYGSRDSFFGVYSGSYKTETFAPKCQENGTKARAELAKGENVSADFRAGIIYREETRLPRLYTTIDVAVINDSGEVLLAGKSREQGKLCFVGGFVDPTDASVEMAACRELHEEVAGIDVGGVRDFKYAGSTLIDDWRYRGSKDRVMTNLFVVHYIFGAPRASDDIDSVVWVPIDEIENVLADYHLPLAGMLKAYLAKQ